MISAKEMAIAAAREAGENIPGEEPSREDVLRVGLEFLESTGTRLPEGWGISPDDCGGGEMQVN